MDVNNKEMAKQEFEAKQKFYGWEVYSQEQIANYGVHVAALMSKAQSNELTEQEQNTLKIGKAELSNLKPVHVVDHCEGRIVKSTVFIQEPQVHFNDTFEKSESGESIQKGVFLDTPLNKELGRVGQELIKGCVKKVAKSDHKMVYGEFLKKGITGVYDEMKKAFPDMTDEEYEDVKKAFEPDEQPEKKEEDEGDEEEYESEFAKALNIINNNFNKGLISEEVSNEAANQLDNILKARNVKYFKREGSPGKYKYYYTKEQYDKAKGGKEEPKSEPKSEEGEKKQGGEFKVGDVVYNKKHDTVGIVRLGEEWGEVKTNADGNVPVTDLVKYDHEKHKDVEIAPSAQKETAEKIKKMTESKDTDTKPEAKKEEGGEKKKSSYLNEHGVHEGYISLTEGNESLVRKPYGDLDDNNFKEYKPITDMELDYLESLDVVESKSGNEVPRYNPNKRTEDYMLKVGEDFYFVDTQGADYPRYMMKLNFTK